MLRVEEITGTVELERLRPEWEKLWQCDFRATPFQSPAWLIPWWRQIGQGQIWALAVRRDGGELVGLLPLYVYSTPGICDRQLFPLGIATTDYLDGLFAAGMEQQAVATIWRHLDAHRQRWDRCELPQLREDSPLRRVPVPRGWADESGQAESCPILALQVGGTLRECVPARMVQNLGYYRRRAEREGTLSFQTADEDTVEEILEALLALHAARWSSRRESGVLARPEVQRAHRESLPELLRLGLLRLQAMRLDGRIVAVLYGLIDRPGPGRRFYYYLGGMDPALERLSPGTLLLGHAMCSAMDDRCGVFDFLRGQEAYKYLWGARDTPTFRRALRHSGIRHDRVAADAGEAHGHKP